MSSFTVAEGRLAGLFVESIILGLYLVTFTHTLQALFWDGARLKRINELNKALVAVTLIMFVNVILGSVTSYYIVWRAFILLPQGEGMATFMELSNWAVVLKSADLLTQTTVGDAMLIYRCWIIYHRFWPVIIPSVILWIGGTICSIFLVYYEITSNSSALISASKLHPFGVAFWASTVSLNIITTTLLVWPIWKAAHNHDRFVYYSTSSRRYNRMKDVMYVVIESGLMYTIAAFVTFATYTSKHNSLYIASSAEVGIAGIAFDLIITRTANVRTKSSRVVSNSVPLRVLTPHQTSVVPSHQTAVCVLVPRNVEGGRTSEPPELEKLNDI